MRLFFSRFLLSLLLGMVARNASSKVAARNWHQLRIAADTAAPLLDTAHVVAEFFAHQRKVSRTTVLPDASFVVLVNYSLAYSKSETTFQQVGRGLSVASIGYFSYRLGKALVQLRRYRAAREHTLLATLARGEPLPPHVRTKLAAYLRPAPAGP